MLKIYETTNSNSMNVYIIENNQFRYKGDDNNDRKKLCDSSRRN